MATPRLRLVKPKPSGAIVVQPQSRASIKWTPSLIRAAEISADGGDMRMVGELCEWLLGDDQISRDLHQRAQALVALEPSFEKSGDRRKSSRVVRALEAGEDWWDGWPEPQLVQLVVWGILAGFSVARHAWEVKPGHGGRILPMPQVWDVQHTRFDFMRGTWIARVVNGPNAAQYGHEEAFAPGDGTWILHAPHGPDKPWRRGLWRGLARFRLLRQYAVEDIARLGEGITRNVVEADKDVKQTKEFREEIAHDLAEMGRDGTIVLPSGFTYKLVSAAQGGVAVFEKQFEIAERAIHIAIRGGNLTSNVDGQGSRAAAEVQERLGDRANLAFDAQSLTTTVHDQSLTWWAEFNFGSAELAPWPVYPVEPEEDLKAKTEGEEKAFTVVEKAEQLGFEVDREAFLREHKITWAKPGQKAVPPTPVLPPGQPGQPPAGGSDEEPDAEESDDEEDGGQRAENRALSREAFRVRLASGEAPRRARGFVEGQLYADALTERALERGRAALHPTIDAILEELEAATDYNDLRERLRARYRTMSPEELSGLVQSAMLLGELAGRTAVNRDA